MQYRTGLILTNYNSGYPPFTMMKYKSPLTLLLICFATALFAQPKAQVADKILAVVGNKIILKSDIDNSILDMQRQGMDVPENAHCLILEQAMGIKALVLQAEKDSLPVTDEEVDIDIDNRIRNFISAYGSKEELEKVAGRSVYQLKEDFREGIRDQMLGSAMRNKIVADVKITPNEVKAYFDKIPADSLVYYESEVEVGQIVIYPKASRDAEEYAIEQLNDLKKQVEAGKDFRALAANNSDDPSAKPGQGGNGNGGQFEINRTQQGFDQTWMNKAFSLKEGQVSAPFKTRFGYHIIQLVSRSGDDAVVRHILKIPQVTNYEMRTGHDKLDSVRALLMTGALSFGMAVDRYSEDEGSKFTGGMLGGANGSFLTIDQLDKDMIASFKALKPGQYSMPVDFADDRGKKGVRIIYLKTQTDPHRENLRDDYSKIATRALEEKKENAIEKWFATKLSSYYIRIDDAYRSCDALKKWVTASNVAMPGKN